MLQIIRKNCTYLQHERAHHNAREGTAVRHPGNVQALIGREPQRRLDHRHQEHHEEGAVQVDGRRAVRVVVASEEGEKERVGDHPGGLRNKIM